MSGHKFIRTRLKLKYLQTWNFTVESFHLCIIPKQPLHNAHWESLSKPETYLNCCRKKIYQNLNTYCKNVEYVRLNTEFVVPDYWPQFNSCYLLKVTFVYVHVEYICNYPWNHWYLKWARACKILLVKMLRLLKSVAGWSNDCECMNNKESCNRW